MIPVFSQGGITYAVGDGLAVAASLPPGYVAHTITDPPYTKHVHDRMHSVTGGTGVDVECPFDPLTAGDEAKICAALGSVARRWSVIFCALEQLGAYTIDTPGDRWIKSGAYLKQRCMPQLTGDRPGSRVEGIALRHGRSVKLAWNNKGRSGLFLAMPEHRKATRHVSAKPIELMIQLIAAFTEPGELVFDPFAGTGSTAIAAELLGRKCLAVEIDPAYIPGFLARRAEALAQGEKLIRRAHELATLPLFTQEPPND